MSGKIEAPKIVGCIKIGITDTAISDMKYQRSMWQNSGIVRVDGKVSFGAGTRISNRGVLHFGNKVRVTSNTSFICYKEIEIGSNTIISWDVLLMDNDLHMIYSNGSEELIEECCINEPKKIKIGEHCWIGCRSLLLKGICIPNNTIVAAASTISSSYERENTIVSSNRVLKDNVNWRE